MRFALLFLVLLAPATSSANDLDFLVGTWATVKDGLGMTVVITPTLGGTALHAVGMTDDGSRVGSETLYTPIEGGWQRTWFGYGGNWSTFVGGFDTRGQLVFLHDTFNGRALDPSPSRIVYRATEAGFELDWQSRGDDGTFEARPDPFVYTRVDRPVPPSGPGRIAFISDRDGNWEIYTMDPDGSNVKNLSNHPGGDHSPRWVAGGTRLAFRSQRSRDDGGWDRHEIDRDGTDLARVDMPGRLPKPEFGSFPELHPSGSYVANTAERGDTQHLYVWRFDGGGERLVAPGDGPDSHARFSPDGERILFISERDGNPEIYSVAFDGDDLRRLTDNPGVDRYCEWSPDGEWIAFASDRDHGAELDVYVMRPDGSDVRRLTATDAEEGEIGWSPDGSTLCFRSNAYGSPEICTVDVASGVITRLTSNRAYDGEPVWSPIVPAIR